jgi:plasmid stabilization system protein ParE
VKIIWTEPALDELVLIYQYLLDNTSISVAKSIIEYIAVGD